MRYYYKVIKSKSPEMPIGKGFVTQEKLHDGRKKEYVVELSDVSCRDYWLRCVKVYTDEEWEEHKQQNYESATQDYFSHQTKYK